MIPFIRSLSELKAITESRNCQRDLSENDKKDSLKNDSGLRKRYFRSLGSNEVVLPNLSKTIRVKWKRNRDNISKIIDSLDYNNQIQSSFDLILLERQNKSSKQDVA